MTPHKQRRRDPTGDRDHVDLLSANTAVGEDLVDRLPGKRIGSRDAVEPLLQLEGHRLGPDYESRAGVTSVGDAQNHHFMLAAEVSGRTASRGGLYHLPRFAPVLALVALLAMTSGCTRYRHHTTYVGSAPAKYVDERPAFFGDVVARAAAVTLHDWPQGFRNDCSGFVEATLARVGFPIRGSTAMFWSFAAERGWTHRRRLPRVGDLAFFDNTYDRNGNGRRDDDLSHIAIVIDVWEDGTIELAHSGTSSGRSRFVMNLFRPHDRVDHDGIRINDALRRRGENGSSHRTLAAELLHGFATIRP